MKKTDAAYIAGIFDGEGYIGISRCQDKQSSRGYSFVPKCMVDMTNPKAIEFIRNAVSKNCLVYKEKARNSRSAGRYRLIIFGAYLPQFLRIIKPFLTIKNKQANLLLRFQSRRTKSTKRLTNNEVKIRQNMYSAIRELNRRGPRK